MVHLTTRFAVLAVASLVALNSVDAIALPAYPSQPAIASGTTSRSEARALPLPLQVQRRKKGGQKHKVEKEYRQRHEDAQFARHANQVFFQRGRYSRRSVRRAHGDIIVNGEHEHIHIVDHDNRHHWADKIIVNGVGEHIHIKDRRSSSPVPAHNVDGHSFVVSRAFRDLPRRGSVADQDSVESGSTLSARDAGQTENVILVSTSSGPEGDNQRAQEEEEEEEEDSSSTLATVTETVTSTVTAPSNDPTTIAAEDQEDSSSTLATITETVTSTVTTSSNVPTATAAEGQSAQEEEDSSPTLATVTETVTSTVTAPSNDPTANAAQDTSESEDASTFIDPSSSSTTPVNAMKVEVFDSSL